MIFIDGSNLFRSVRQYHAGVRIDYEKLRDVLTDGRNLVNIYFFGSRPIPPKEAQEKFYNKLQELGYTTHIVNLKYYKGGTPKEKGVDTSLVIEMLIHAFNKNYDVGILVAGDEDFLKVINEVKRLGPKIEIASFRNSLSDKLKHAGARIIILDDILDTIKH